jgi:hypothetical protein
MLRYGSRPYNFSMLKKMKKLHFWYATVDANSCVFNTKSVYMVRYFSER